MVRHLGLCLFRGLSLQGVLSRQRSDQLAAVDLRHVWFDVPGATDRRRAARHLCRPLRAQGVAAVVHRDDAFGTLAVACMPTFDKIGVLAHLLVIVARLVQGFSAGGEFGSSTAFLVEHMPGRRGFVASFQFASQGISSLLGSGFGVLLSSTLTETELQTWGWRIPFLFGVLIGPIGLYIPNHIEDATEPPAAKYDTPARNVFMG